MHGQCVRLLAHLEAGSLSHLQLKLYAWSTLVKTLAGEVFPVRTETNRATVNASSSTVPGRSFPQHPFHPPLHSHSSTRSLSVFYNTLTGIGGEGIEVDR